MHSRDGGLYREAAWGTNPTVSAPWRLQDRVRGVPCLSLSSLSCHQNSGTPKDGQGGQHVYEHSCCAAYRPQPALRRGCPEH